MTKPNIQWDRNGKEGGEMKKLLVFLCVMAIILGTSTVARAALYDRGGGLIYCDILDITLLQDANYARTSGYNPTGLMGQLDAIAWAENLVNADYDDWRLPHILPINGVEYTGPLS
jgi:hypothetical protein